MQTPLLQPNSNSIDESNFSYDWQLTSYFQLAHLKFRASLIALNIYLIVSDIFLVDYGFKRTVNSSYTLLLFLRLL